MGDDKKTITIDLAEYERQQAQTQEALARIVQLEGAMVAAGLAVPPRPPRAGGPRLREHDGGRLPHDAGQRAALLLRVRASEAARFVVPNETYSVRELCR